MIDRRSTDGDPMALPNRPDTPTIDLAARAVIELADVRLLPSTLTLTREDSRIAVEPRVMQVLVALADGAGAVVSREQLLERCWGRVVVGEDAVHRAVAGARRALRDVGSVRLALDTIPRVGYRLSETAGDPASPDEDSPPAARQPSPAAVAPPASAARRWWIGAAAAVAGAVGLAVWHRQTRTPPEALALIEQGQQALRLALPESDRQGLGFFEQAVRLAPRDATAWGWLALARRQESEYSPPDRLPDAVAATQDAIAKALALDRHQPLALTARALLIPVFGHWAEVDDALKAVLARDPESLPTIDAHSLLLASAGMVSAHYPLRLTTIARDPFHAGYNFRSIFAHWMNGQLPAADRAGERGLELWPRHVATWLARFSVFKFTGRADRALAMLDEGAAAGTPGLPPPLQATLRSVGVALAGGGEARRVAARDGLLAGLPLGGPLAAVGAALDLTALGEVELALDVTEAFLLERGAQPAGTAWRPGQALHYDVRRRFTNHLFLPVTAPLRRHPRFASIMADVGLAGFWQRPGRVPDHLQAAAAPR